MAEQADLPAAYWEWLDTLPLPCYVKFKRREWDIASRAQLTETIRFNRDEVPFHAQLTAYVKMWRGHGHDAAEGPRRQPFPHFPICRRVPRAGGACEELLPGVALRDVPSLADPGLCYVTPPA